jgi:hypothetical protein
MEEQRKGVSGGLCREVVIEKSIEQQTTSVKYVKRQPSWMV